MQIQSVRRPSRAALLMLFLLGLALPLSAQTLLLFVQESTGATPIAPPLSVREGVAEALFAAGVIVVEMPLSYERPADLAALALGAGADLVLDIVSRYADVPAGANRATITISTAFTLVDAATGAVISRESLDATNKDREGLVDRGALGKEIGASVVTILAKALAARAAGKG